MNNNNYGSIIIIIVFLVRDNDTIADHFHSCTINLMTCLRAINLKMDLNCGFMTSRNTICRT